MRRSIGWIVGGALMVLIAFGMGYGAYPLLHAGTPLVLAGAQAAEPDGASEAQSDGLAPFWEAWGLLDRHFLGDDPAEADRYRGAVAGMVSTYGDPYTMLLPPANNELDGDQMRGSFGGIGATIEFSGTRFLVTPMAGYPAAEAGMQEGDELRAVDGVAISATMSMDEVVATLRGEVGSTVELDLRRLLTATTTLSSTQVATAVLEPPYRDLQISVERAEIRTPSVVGALLPDSTIGHLQQSSFTERSAEELEEAVRSLSKEGADRFIWDLRGNPGGLLTAAIDATDLWLADGAIVIEERSDGTSNTTTARRGEIGERFPLVVLVDANSASASEIAAGALLDHERALLVGSPTYGKGSVQTLYELSDQSSLHITTAQWLTPDRRMISGEGLAPDVTVDDGADALAVAREAVLEQPLP